jgi:hypothetical protein
MFIFTSKEGEEKLMNKEEMPNNPIVEGEKKKIVKAELSYNPILEETKVKFNGRSPRINSLIEKYQGLLHLGWVRIPSSL